MQEIRIFLIDDYPVVRLGLKHALDKEAGFRVVGEAGDGLEALKKLRSVMADVAILDIVMPRLGGLESIRPLLELLPDLKIVIFTAFADAAYVKRSLEEGARGYVLKSCPAGNIVSAVRAVWRGEYYLSPEVHRMVISGFLENSAPAFRGDHDQKLTKRERQVMELLVQGNSVPEIADALFISAKTVEKHRANLMAKLRVTSMIELVKFAMRNHIIRPEQWVS